MIQIAKTEPTKRFFLDMLVRDISLEDAVLDLVDNAIDAYFRSYDIDVKDFVLRASPQKSRRKAKIDIAFSDKEFSVTDNCGGIKFDDAKEVVFRFGRVARDVPSVLSVYGIGLKRALFKIGNDIRVESQTKDDGFLLAFKAREWMDNDDWGIPIEETAGAGTLAKSGTKITIRQIHPEVQTRIRDGRVASKLTADIATTYAMFLDAFVELTINGTAVEPSELPIGSSKFITPASEEFSIDGVDVKVLCGVAERSEDEEWVTERAGWYVLCNGRVVVYADKTEMTEWGTGLLPRYASKYRGFFGVAFFFSKNPEALPWTTTKRGLNHESPAYQGALLRMVTLARPVIRYLNDMYSMDEVAEAEEQREIAQTVEKGSIRLVLQQPASGFVVAEARKAAAPSKVSVQFMAMRQDIDRARRCLGRRWSASRIGKHALAYFLEKECP